MILSDRSIALALLNEGLIVYPLRLPIQPASIDLRIGDRAAQTNETTDPLWEQGMVAFYLEPGAFINVCTAEWIEIPDHLVGIVCGRSSWARRGLQVESAGYVDPGWKGRLTLELKNLGPQTIMMVKEDRIAQLRLETLTTRAAHPYGHKDLGSHYQGAYTVEVYGGAGRSQKGFFNPEMALPEKTRQRLIEEYRLLPDGTGTPPELG